jgi:hypothetical protein
MALVTVKLTISQLVHGRMLPVGEPVQIPESFAADFVRKGIATIVRFGDSEPARPAHAPEFKGPPEPVATVTPTPKPKPGPPPPPKKGKR